MAVLAAMRALETVPLDFKSGISEALSNTGMLRSPWICRACIRRIAISRPRWSSLRSASTATSAVAPKSNDDVPSHATTNPITTGLLARARATIDEHTQLSRKLSNDFDPALAKRLGELSHIASAYHEYTNASNALHELQTLIRDPDLHDAAAEDMQPALSRLEQASATLTAQLIPKHPFSHLSCLIEIRPGAGGEEAALFAHDILSMYQAFCIRHRFQAKLLKYEDSDGAADARGSDAPMQEAVLQVDAPGSYDVMRTEAGVHRVQRVPATEAKGRTHTSAASVLVLPSLPEDGSKTDDVNDPGSDYYVDVTQVRTDVFRAKGAGGQHVNTTDSAVRLTHVPTGMAVSVQDERSQHKNRHKAWQILRGRLAQQRREAREEEMLKVRRSTAGHGTSGRGDKVRTYNWGQKRVTDHRSGFSSMRLDDVVGGGEALDEVMDSVREWMMERDIEDLLVGEVHSKQVKK
ncbi:MAG: hypothetical protein M1831_004031 [Alyxoria varia]|nr:MAG: hypothetical protein M1831_004031 [Alyxoria varia]